MAHVLFAQSIAEYGAASGFAATLSRFWTEIVLTARGFDTTTWIVIGVVGAVVLWWLLKR